MNSTGFGILMIATRLEQRREYELEIEDIFGFHLFSQWKNANLFELPVWVSIEKV